MSGYTSLSIHQKRFKNIKKGYKTTIEPYTKDTLTGWATQCLELNLIRIEYLKQIFPNLSVIKSSKNELTIEDSQNDIVVKITMKNKKLSSSHKGKEAESYIMYASLHPQFHLV